MGVYARAKRRPDFDVSDKISVKIVEELGAGPLDANGLEEVPTPFGVKHVEKLKIVKNHGDDVLLDELRAFEVRLKVP